MKNTRQEIVDIQDRGVEIFIQCAKIYMESENLIFLMEEDLRKIQEMLKDNLPHERT